MGVMNLRRNGVGKYEVIYMAEKISEKLKIMSDCLNDILQAVLRIDTKTEELEKRVLELEKK